MNLFCYGRDMKLLNQGNPINVIHPDFCKAKDKKMRTELDLEKLEG